MVDRSLMRQAWCSRFAGSRAPNPCTSLAGGDDPLSVRAESGAQNRGGVSDGVGDEFACGDVPDTRSPVVAGADHTATIGAELRVVDLAPVEPALQELGTLAQGGGQAQPVDFGPEWVLLFGLHGLGKPGQAP